ncbi:helix-turn-helix domain-containing protein (plasmid) [Isosphaeraceae bacterium EP7]
MALITLQPAEREHLRGLARHSDDRRVIHRALALLDLDSGQPPLAVAARLGVSRSTVYNWAGRFAKERDPSPSLGDRPRAGRPPAARRAAEESAEAALGTDPRAAGYRHTNWTVPLLLAHLNRASGQQASGTTMRRALHGLGYRWKRPRFVLSRRSPTWRQAKGG